MSGFNRFPPLCSHAALISPFLMGVAACGPREGATPNAAAPNATSETVQPSDTSANEPESAAETVEHAQPLRDGEILSAVQRELFLDRGVNGSNIKVAVTDGVVEFTGTVDSLLAQKRAERLASVVKGVRAVVNRIRLRPTVRSDAAIQQDVHRAMQEDPTLTDLDITSKVKDQNVTLSGTVQSWVEQDLAGRLAESVKGVRSVDNQIAVRYTTSRSDRTVQKDVAAKLDWDALVDDAGLKVKVVGGTVIFDGSVGSLAEKDRAIRDAYVVPGVKAVDADKLEVAWWMSFNHLRENGRTNRSDSDIRAALQDAMLLDPRVDRSNFDIDVKAGVVYLSGSVDNARARRIAAKLAHDTTGVRAVRDEVGVRPRKNWSDFELEGRVRGALARNPVVDSDQISVAARGGNVTLTGRVQSFAQKAEAADVALDLTGVVGVVDKLDVEYPTPIGYSPYLAPYSAYITDFSVYMPTWQMRSDPEMRSEIVTRLDWNPFVDVNDVTVTVHNGEVVLDGSVPSWHAYNEAAYSAMAAGAIGVDNKLTVR